MSSSIAAKRVAIKPMRLGDEEQVSDLVSRIFKEFIAPHFSQEGVSEILNYVHPDALARRALADHFVLLAKLNGEQVGVIEVRKNSHISLLFVDGRYQRRGIARQLIAESVEIIEKNNPSLDKLTVNSSPNAVEAYRSLGFLSEEKERMIKGIRFKVMSLSLANQGRKREISSEVGR